MKLSRAKGPTASERAMVREIERVEAERIAPRKVPRGWALTTYRRKALILAMGLSDPTLTEADRRFWGQEPAEPPRLVPWPQAELEGQDPGQGEG